MINRELQLIGKILQTGDIRTVIKARISKSMFATPEGRAAFRYLWDYYHNPKTAGLVPKRGFFLEKFPAFPKNIKTQDVTVNELCEYIREAALTREVNILNDDVAARAQSDPYKALELLGDGLTKLRSMTASSGSTLLSDMADVLIEEYELGEQVGGVTGVPFPWDPLTRATGGMQEEDFILMYADHKTLKSFLGILLGIHAYREANRRVLYYAAEMNNKLIARRSATAFMQLPYQGVKQYNLSPAEKTMYKETLRELAWWETNTKHQGRSARFLIVKDSAERSGINQLMAEIESFEPDLVIADSYYRMAGDYDWKVQAGLTKTLKSTAERYKIPIIGISQRNRDNTRGAGDRGMGDIGYTLAGAQETDLGFRLLYDGENEDGSVTLHFIIAAAREIKEKGFTIRFAPYNIIEWCGWLTEEDLAEITRRQKEQGKGKKSGEDLSGEVYRKKQAAEERARALAAFQITPPKVGK